MKCKKLESHTISYQSILLSTIVINDMYNIVMHGKLPIVIMIYRNYGLFNGLNKPSKQLQNIDMYRYIKAETFTGVCYVT